MFERTIRPAKTAVIPFLPGVSKARLPDPPCPHLLLSNQAPTDAECKLVQDAIAQTQEELARLASMLLRRRRDGDLNRDIQTRPGWELVTAHKVDQANAFIRQYQGVLSPIRKLPTEILQQVFLLVAHHSRCRNPQRRLNKHLPWALTQTCRSWRVVALGTPSLWNHLPTVRLKQSRTITKMQIEYLSEILQRSAGLLLDLCIDATDIDPDRASRFHHHPTVDLVCQHAERWETAAIILRSYLLTGLWSIKGRLTALKSLDLSASIRPMMLSAMDLFEDAPLLTSVRIGALFPKGLLLPFTQLRHFEESIDYEEGQNNLVMRSPVLETLTIFTFADDIVLQRLTVPCLVQLRVEFASRADAGCFDNLTLPCIQVIQIIACKDNLASTLLRMLQNSSPCLSLKSLDTRFRTMDPGQLTSLLELTPALVHLKATITSTSDMDIDNIASAGLLDRPLVPFLETCEFYASEQIGEGALRALNRLASTRCEPPLETTPTNTEPQLFPYEFCHLKSLVAAFAELDYTSFQRQHSCLEGWLLTTTSFDLSWMLDGLVKIRPDLMYHRCHEGSGIWSRSENNKVGKILVNTESLKVNNARDIYFSGVLYALNSIAKCQCTSTKNPVLAKQILDKWKPMTEDPEALKRRHWAMQRGNSLIYISDDSDIRKNYPRDIVLGLRVDSVLSP